MENTDAVFAAPGDTSNQAHFAQELLSLLATQLRSRGIRATLSNPKDDKGIAGAIVCALRDWQIHVQLDHPVRGSDSVSIWHLMCIDLPRFWLSRMFSSLPNLGLGDVVAIVHEALTRNSGIRDVEWVDEGGVDKMIDVLKRRIREASE
ncbi:MAG TPA: hypothetical protein VF950_13410 [Planctomycetota bacterium]